jgi:Na+/H+ antiporter NhaD/arsenite permease-like protein
MATHDGAGRAAAARPWPAVARERAEPAAGWLTLAASSTLAGNLTLLGSVANLIVAESAARQGVTLGFWAYTRAGLIITALSLALGGLWLQWVVWGSFRP